jgi:hypothetical protein
VDEEQQSRLVHLFRLGEGQSLADEPPQPLAADRPGNLTTFDSTNVGITVDAAGDVYVTSNSSIRLIQRLLK